MSRPLKILVVDDDPDGAEGLADLISMFGHESSVAYSGAEAVSASAEAPFDLTFLDLHMPGMDGMAAYQAINKCNPGSQVVLITGVADEVLEQKIRDCANLRVLRKPVDVREILKTIEHVQSLA